jgi:hypothetical protein
MKNQSLAIVFSLLAVLGVNQSLVSAQGMVEAGSVYSMSSMGSPLTRSFAKSVARVYSAPSAKIDSLSSDEQSDASTVYGNQANDLYQKAMAAQRKGDKVQAEKLYRQSMEIRQSVWGSRDPAVPQIMMIVSKLEQDQGRLADSEQTARKALSAMTRMYGASSEYIKPQERRLAEVLAARGKESH